VPWVEVFAVFIVCHLTGDYLLQTDWQAANKRRGLGGDPVRRRALVSHVTTYTLAYVPALVWLATEIDFLVIAIVALIFFPHLVQDDGRLLDRYMLDVKKLSYNQNPLVFGAVDQSFHVLTLFGISLLAAV
jgi:Protein of unknown function (DUF3307)